jgi:hypothetical protein
VVAGEADLLLPARSATLVVLTGAGNRLFADGFESAGTGAWSNTVGG